MPRWINAPNLLTLVRLALVPFILRAIFHGDHWLALSLFACAGVTDVLDGALARRFGETTMAGAYLDPVADKCLLSGVFLALAAAGYVPWWFVLIVFGRDLYLVAGTLCIMAATPARKFPPSLWGKAATFVQILTAVTWMARNALQSPVLGGLPTAMLWVSAAFTVWSGIHYTWRELRILIVH
jgi:cardiolipin synthase